MGSTIEPHASWVRGRPRPHTETAGWWRLRNKSAIPRQPSGWSPRPGKAKPACAGATLLVRAEALPERAEAPAGL